MVGFSRVNPRVLIFLQNLENTALSVTWLNPIWDLKAVCGHMDPIDEHKTALSLTWLNRIGT